MRRVVVTYLLYSWISFLLIFLHWRHCSVAERKHWTRTYNPVYPVQWTQTCVLISTEKERGIIYGTVLVRFRNYRLSRYCVFTYVHEAQLTKTVHTARLRVFQVAWFVFMFVYVFFLPWTDESFPFIF